MQLSRRKKLDLCGSNWFVHREITFKHLKYSGAILISLYIASSWFITGYQQTVMLSGLSAKPQLINRIVKVALEHDSRIREIDTVYAYHYGTKLLAEVCFETVRSEEVLLATRCRRSGDGSSRSARFE